MTQQSHYDQTDVNAIVARFERTGHMPLPVAIPQYGDVTHLQKDLTTLIEQSRETLNTLQEFEASWTPKPEAPPEPPTPTPTPTPQTAA